MSLRLWALADGQARSLTLNGERVAEAEIRWRAEYDRGALLASADRLQSSALDGARRLGRTSARRWPVFWRRWARRLLKGGSDERQRAV
ncbi:Uncharacterised protein [Chromobacterium violaceum]|uniref:Uncharacterized protein n=1 Tax=Chromobacterium violaceum TaxID=536 RepID=A0A3S4HQV9_CHRVL|nr:Uncharacterised protein [Chromobacterium violaceum]